MRLKYKAEATDTRVAIATLAIATRSFSREAFQERKIVNWFIKVSLICEDIVIDIVSYYYNDSFGRQVRVGKVQVPASTVQCVSTAVEAIPAIRCCTTDATLQDDKISFFNMNS